MESENFQVTHYKMGFKFENPEGFDVKKVVFKRWISCPDPFDGAEALELNFIEDVTLSIK